MPMRRPPRALQLEHRDLLHNVVVESLRMINVETCTMKSARPEPRASKTAPATFANTYSHTDTSAGVRVER